MDAPRRGQHQEYYNKGVTLEEQHWKFEMTIWDGNLKSQVKNRTLHICR